MRDPKTMTDSELNFAIDDAAITAHAMDSLDRVDGLDRAGKYRDECAALRAEKWARCKSCKGLGHVQEQVVKGHGWFTMNLGCNCCGKPAIGVVS